MADPRPLLRELARVDRRGAVWCAALCAMSVAHLVPAEERRPWRALRLALLWAQGVEVPEKRMEMAAAGMVFAMYDGVTYSDFYACEAALEAISALRVVPGRCPDTASLAAWRAINSYSQVGDYDFDVERDRETQAIAALAALVEHQIAPVAVTPGDVAEARHAAAVAWDWLDRPDPVRVGTLGDALARARRWRLRWHVPIERALAERTDTLPAAILEAA